MKLPRLSRRMMIGTALGAAAAGIGGGWAYISPTAYAASIVRNQLPYLKLAPGALAAFARDVAENRHLSDRQREAMLFGVRLSRGLAGLAGGETREKVETFEIQLVSLFLMSTDFFQNGADIAKTVNYVALADPYVSACSNSLAVLA
jgi:hypothetical protein